jgi:hypothetical protein
VPTGTLISCRNQGSFLFSSAASAVIIPHLAVAKVRAKGTMAQPQILFAIIKFRRTSGKGIASLKYLLKSCG